MLANLLISFVYLAGIYFIPGFILSRFFKGSLRNNLFFILFLATILRPFIYLFLGGINRITGPNWLVFSIALLFLAYVITNNIKNHLIDTDSLFKMKVGGISSRSEKWFKRLFYLVLVSFFFLVIIGKIGMAQGYIPVGDDQPQMQKTTSIAESPGLPLFYNYPISDLTIYYFNNIGSGLTTKFTHNFIPVNQSWFIRTIVSTVVLLYLVYLLGVGMFATFLERFVLAICLTFGSGLEFFLAQIKGFNGNHLEWWTDWVGLNPKIHMQISAFFTLFYWVPQHLFGGLLVIPIYFLIISTERKKLLGQIFLGMMFATIVGYTVFVFITLIFIYTLYFIVRLIRKEEKFITILKENLVAGVVGVILAAPMLLLYKGAEKGSWFIFHTNVFWFLPNNVLLYRPINIVLTALIYFLVEFGPLVIIFVYGFFLFFKKKKYQTPLLFWGLFLYVPVWVIFFVRAMDDDNISMRSLIPMQIALAIFAAWVVGYWREKWKMKNWWPKFLGLSLAVLIVCNLPTTLYEVYHRYTNQFDKPDPIYSLIDQKLPMNSIVFSYTRDNIDLISVAGHRFSFKPLNMFTVTDYEYVAAPKISRYTSIPMRSQSWLKILKEHPEISQNYHLYVLESYDQYITTPYTVLKSDKFLVNSFPK